MVFDLLKQRKVFVAFGHRSDESYVLAHLAPKKHYQCFFDGQLAALSG